MQSIYSSTHAIDCCEPIWAFWAASGSARCPNLDYQSVRNKSLGVVRTVHSTASRFVAILFYLSSVYHSIYPSISSQSGMQARCSSEWCSLSNLTEIVTCYVKIPLLTCLTLCYDVLFIFKIKLNLSHRCISQQNQHRQNPSVSLACNVLFCDIVNVDVFFSLSWEKSHHVIYKTYTCMVWQRHNVKRAHRRSMWIQDP